MTLDGPARVLKFVVFAVAMAAILGYAVMRLWNWLMPELFGWHVIHFWQALGLLFLCKILFGGFRGRPGRHLYGRRRLMQRMVERWEQMTPEEREKFREAMRGRCRPFGPAATPKA